MPYFKDMQNKLYFIPPGCVPIGEHEARSIEAYYRNLQTPQAPRAPQPPVNPPAPPPVAEKTEEEIEQERILFQMAEIERQITPRRLREAILSDDGRGWLMNWEKELQELRNELKELKNMR